MIRRFFICFGAIVFLASSSSLSYTRTAFASAVKHAQRSPAPPPNSGTLVLSGYMRSRATVTLTGAFSVGHLTNLEWFLPNPTSLRLSGYTEHVRSMTYRFSVQPTSVSTVNMGYFLARRYVWAAPPANTIIRVREILRLGIVSRLTPFHSRARYPLARVPAYATPYLRVTPMLRLKKHGIRLAHWLAGGKRTERAVVTSVANYIASTTHYDGSLAESQMSASWALSHHLANCRGYANAMAGLLRKLGIPSQVEYGWVSGGSMHFPSPGGTYKQVEWAPDGSSGELHVWLNIYFPHRGWVPFDPQVEKFFIDPHHFSFYANVDAGQPGMGQWSATPVAHLPMTRSNLRYGLGVIVPGDGYGSRVSIRSHDYFRVGLRRTYKDVRDVLMFQR